MSSNFERLHNFVNEAYGKNFSILSQKMANPPLYLALHFLIGIPFTKVVYNLLIVIFYWHFLAIFGLLFFGEKIFLTFINSVADIASPSTLVNKMHKRIDICSTLPTSDNGGTLNHLEKIKKKIVITFVVRFDLAISQSLVIS